MMNNELVEDKKSTLLWRFGRSLAFNFDAEAMHEMAIHMLKIKSTWGFNTIPSYDKNLAKNIFDLDFAHPIGLAAGFDVDGECVPALSALGFSFIEVGGITKEAQAGNARPRIFRLPKDQALINRLNFYNKGAANLKKNISNWRNKGLIKVPLGVNLGKSSLTSLDTIAEEYTKLFLQIADIADYVTINISCPNTHNLTTLQTTNNLCSLLHSLANANEKRPKKIPLLLKLGPDLSTEEAMACAAQAGDFGLAGLIISNTTTKRDGLLSAEKYIQGGLSGKPLFERSTELLRFVAQDYAGKLVLVGSGGIMDGASALAKLHAGADLLQVYSGFIYGGPNFVFDLLKYLRMHYFMA
jgi:dihydroorotate dehydrogenase